MDPEEEEGEKVLSSDLADDGQDTRRCVLCWHYGDADPNVCILDTEVINPINPCRV